jgi:hypothetical protein
MNETTENNEKVQGPEVESRQRRTFLKSALVVTASMSRIGRGLAAWSVAGPVDAAGIRDLKTKVRGEVLVPGDAGYDAGRAGFELSAGGGGHG